MKAKLLYPNVSDPRMLIQLQELLNRHNDLDDSNAALAARVTAIEEASGGEEGEPGGGLDGTGTTGFNVTQVTSTYTVQGSDDVVLCDGTFTVSLPPASLHKGKVFHIKNKGTGNITVGVTGSGDLIDDETTQTLFPNEGVSVVSDIEAWHIF